MYGSPYSRAMAASPDEIQIFLDAFRRIVQALRVADRAAQTAAGLSAAQLFVLRSLAAADGPLDLRALATRTHTHHSSVSVVVQRLVERRYVSRRRATADARRAEVRLTARGRGVLGRVPRAPQERLIAQLDALPAGQRRRLAGDMKALAAAVTRSATPPRMFFEGDVAATRRGRS